MSEDAELLHRYAVDHSEIAFTELIQRHVGLVYSAALRLVNGDTHRAQDVTQLVFAKFARQANRLMRHPAPIGWLYTTTRLTALQTLRTERRRSAREQEASTMTELLHESTPEPDWVHMRPVLEEAMHELGEKDRLAVLLRFFQNKSLKEVGAELGLRENAAQMRVERALDKLRTKLVRRGITTTAAALSVVLSANAVQTVPVVLAASVSAAALAGTTISTSTALAVTKTVAMTIIQKTLIAAAVTALAGAGIYEARQVSHLRSQVQALQQPPLDGQIQQWQHEREDMTNRLAALQAENAQLKSTGNSSELLRLRGEVGRLRTEANSDALSKSTKVADRVALIKQLLAQRPNLSVPELHSLHSNVWQQLAEAPFIKLDTEDNIRSSFAYMRLTAKAATAGMFGHALEQYATANNGQLPGDLSELNPYLPHPVDPAILQRYQLLHTGKLSDYAESEPLVAENAPVDNDYDFLEQINTGGYTSEGVGKMAGNRQISMFAANTNGQFNASMMMTTPSR